MSEKSSQLETQPNDNGNGGSSGILQRMGKFSWTLILVGMIGGPISTYYMTRQEITVDIATIQLQITQHGTEIQEIKKTLQDMVPRQVHEARAEMQKEIDRLKEQLQDERRANLQRELDDLKAKK